MKYKYDIRNLNLSFNSGVSYLGAVLLEMALRGLKVVEMAGLAPAPMAGMILAGQSSISLRYK